MADDNMERLENATPIPDGDPSFDQSREINRINGHKQAHDPERMLDGASHELEANTFELLEEALVRGAKISREDAAKISERYSHDYFEGTRGQRQRSAMIVTGILETFKDDVEFSY